MDPVDPQPRNVITRASCPSTQDIARDEALAGAPAGTAVITDHQTAGRGRRGRTWTDPPGTALMFSYVARPRRALAELGALPLVAGIAIAERLPGRPRVRWPNDLVVDGGKVAGILVEAVTPPDGDPFAIIGVGINANLTAEQLPTTDRLPATSLRIATGEEVDRAALFHEVAAHLDACLAAFDADGFAPLLPRYAALDDLAGRALELRLPDGPVRGAARGVDGGGRLLLEVDGEIRPFSAGEVERVVD